MYSIFTPLCFNIHFFFSEIADYITKPLYDVEENVGGKSDIIRYEVSSWDVPDIRYPVGY